MQGDRTVGINERPPQALLDGIERAFGFTPPQHHGHDAVASFEAMVEGRSKVLVCLGGNLAIAMPDPEMCNKAMRNLDMAVHVLTKLNRSTLLIGKESIILPCLGRTEADIQATGQQFVTVEDSMSMVHASKGNLPPASKSLRSEPAIVAGIAVATLPKRRSTGITWSRITTGSAMRLKPCSRILRTTTRACVSLAVSGCPWPHTERVWKTASGKAEFLIYEGLNANHEEANGMFRLATSAQPRPVQHHGVRAG